MTKILDVVKPGVLVGEDVQKVFAVAKENGYALPAVNCVGPNTINAVGLSLLTVSKTLFSIKPP